MSRFGSDWEPLGIWDSGFGEDRERKIKKSKRKDRGSVYFIQEGGRMGPIKIGFSTNVENRLMTLQTANPNPLKLLYSLRGTEAQEATLHERFKHLRMSGEWFRCSPELLDFINCLFQHESLDTVL